MFPPRLLESRPPAQQILIATIPALLLGIVVGLALDVSAGLYVVLLIVAVLGGVAAGFEHRSAIEGGERGIVGGLLFGAGLLVGHHLLSRRAKASLPQPEAIEVIITALISIPLGMIGGALRGRRERGASEGEATEHG